MKVAVIHGPTEGVLAMFRAVLNLPVGDNAAPEDTSGMYLIIYNTGGSPPNGSWGSPHEDITMAFDFVSVGTTATEARHLADAAHQAWLHQGDNGQYLRPIDAGPGLAVTRRWCEIMPSLQPADSSVAHRVVSLSGSYRMTVSAAV